MCVEESDLSVLHIITHKTCHCSPTRLYVSLPARKYVMSRWRRNEKQTAAWSLIAHTKNGYEIHQSSISALINTILEKMVQIVFIISGGQMASASDL